MPLLWYQLLLMRKISTHSDSPLWKTVKKKLASSKKSYTLSRVLTFQTYPTLSNLKKLPIPSHRKLNTHGEWIQIESTSQSIPRVGGMKSVDVRWTSIEWQEIWKTGKGSRAQLKLQSDLSLIPKFKKLLTKNKNLGNSWARLTSTSCLLLRPSNTMINNVSTSMTCETHFIPLSI